MGTTHTPRRRTLGLTAHLGEVVASATLIFTAAAGDAGASTSKFCKDGNSFGYFLNDAGGGRATFVKARSLAQRPQTMSLHPRGQVGMPWRETSRTH